MVLRGGERTPAVRAKDRAPNRVGVTLESDQQLSALCLPEPRVARIVIRKRYAHAFGVRVGHPG
jgi:hypothetical protein